MKRLWERNREERKETYRKPSTRTSNEDMRDQVQVKRENVKAQADTSTDQATVKQDQEEWNGRNRKSSSKVLKLKLSKEKLKSSIRPSLRNQKGITCGTAVGAKQDRAKENKQMPSTRTKKECMRNQTGKNGENILSEILICLLYESLLDKYG